MGEVEINSESNKYLFGRFRTQFNDVINDLSDGGKKIDLNTLSKHSLIINNR